MTSHNMSVGGRVRIVVKSRRVPSRVIEVNTAHYLLFGNHFLESKRVVLYEWVLDDEYLKMIDEGRRLACALGLGVEIVDCSKLSLFRRMLLYLGDHGFGSVKMVVSLPSHGLVLKQAMT